jgi:hypothetical protein
LGDICLPPELGLVHRCMQSTALPLMRYGDLLFDHLLFVTAKKAPHIQHEVMMDVLHWLSAAQ